MFKALLQVTVPLFQLIPYSQESFIFQVMVPLSGNQSQCMATIFGLLVQTQTFKYNWKSLHTVLEELKICLQKNKCKQVDMPHLSSFILKGQSRKAPFSSQTPTFFFFFKWNLTPTVFHEKTTLGSSCSGPNLIWTLLIIWKSPPFIPFHIGL